MTRLLKSFFLMAVVGASVPALAQSNGRTDGPENSEIGKGGYPPASLGRLSLTFDFGGAVGPLGKASFPNAVPLYLGLTPSFWLADFFTIDLYGGYNLNTKNMSVFIGPRVRTPTWPFSGSLGLRAGPMIYTEGGTNVRFAVSPLVSLDMVLMRHAILGLQMSFDLPLDGAGPEMRIGLNIGWRF